MTALTPEKLAEIRRRIETKDNDVYWAEEDWAALAAEVERLSGEVERLAVGELRAAAERVQAINATELDNAYQAEKQARRAAESSISRLTERAETAERRAIAAEENDKISRDFLAVEEGRRTAATSRADRLETVLRGAKRALEACREKIVALPKDAFGTDGYGDRDVGFVSWPITEEYLHYLDQDIARIDDALAEEKTDNDR